MLEILFGTYIVVAVILYAFLLTITIPEAKKDGFVDIVISVIFGFAFSLFWTITIPLLIYQSWKEYKDDISE